MKLVVLGLSLSSSWGNGHATTYRALLRAFAARGHQILFLERDVPWYASQRDLPRPDFCAFGLYDTVAGLARWQDTIAGADAVIVGSYVPDGMAVGDWVLERARGITAFYDIDTPITVAALQHGDAAYLARRQIGAYDTYLSFTGGPMLDRLCQEFGARHAAALYCSVDAARYRAVDIRHRWDLSYLGTYSPDRQPMLDRLLVQPARAAPHRRFVVAGPQYPADLAWPSNVERIDHVPPDAHAKFYSESRYTLNVTRADMVAAGYSPSVRLFEAAACGTAIVSDPWLGLDSVLGEGEITVASTASQVLAALDAPDATRAAMAQAGRARVVASHTADHRAAELEAILQSRMAIAA